MRTLPFLCCLALIFASGVAPAQTRGNATGGNQTGPPAPPSYFSELFPNPTHNNGYEEWVQAADLIQGNADVEAATAPDATLSFKRKLLANPAVVQALHLLREGLEKPVAPPRKTVDPDTRFPELAGFRRLARLLATEQYVDFAEGRVDAAIDSLQVGLAFGYRIQTDSIIGGLVGLSVDTIVLNAFGQHLDQLSVYHCDRVSRIVEEFLNAENPAIRLMALEKGYTLKTLESQRKDPKALLSLLDSVNAGEDPAEAANYRSLQVQITNQPESLNAILDDAESRISAQYDQALLNLSLPLAQRKPIVKDESNTPAAFLARAVTINPDPLQDRYSSDQARLRLLGLHVLIHRYRWEHNTLPNALSELHAEKLVTDPFTGDQIIYKRDDDRYTLSSAGPFQRDENGQTTKERAPVKLSR